MPILQAFRDKKKTCYKFYVEAQKKTASGYTTKATSEEGHALTSNRRGKATNPKSLKTKGYFRLI